MNSHSQLREDDRPFGPFLSLITGTDFFFREVVVLFYGLYVLFFLAFNIFDYNMGVVFAFRFALHICTPGILFGIGWQLGRIDCKGNMASGLRSANSPGSGSPAGGKPFSNPSVKRRLLGLALISWLYYVAAGIALHVFAYNEECLKTIKNILFAILIPNDGGIFLTCALVFLLFALAGDRIMKLMENRRLIFAICLAGLLTALIPEGLIGYGLFGLLIGGDVAGAVPLSFFLTPLFFGIVCGRRGHYSLKEKGTAGLTAAFLLSGALVLALHLGLNGSLLNRLEADGTIISASITGSSPFNLLQLALVLLGTGLSMIGLLILRAARPLYAFLENILASVFLPLYRLFYRERAKTVPGTRRYLIYYYVVFAIAFAAISFFVFVPYIDGGFSLIWESDGLGQYVPKAYRFVRDMPDIIRSLAQGSLNFKQYDFATGLGAPMNYSFDPVYWLYLLAGEGRIEMMYNAAVIIRYFLAGAAMSAVILYLGKSRRMALVASFVYIYSGYALFAGTRHSQFITPMILFPLLVIAMERLIRKRSWYLMTILAALSLFCSYYFLYMNTIAIGIYFVWRILTTKEYRNWKTFFERGLIITGSYVLGTSIALVSLVTSFGGYLGSSRSGGGDVAALITNNTLFYRSEWLIDIAAALVAVDFGPGQWLRIGMAPAVLFAAVLLFTRKNRPALRLSFLTCLVFCIFPVFGYIMSGFSSVTNRWVYIFTGVLAVILAANLDAFTSLTKKELKIISGIAGGYFLLMLIGLKFRTTGIQGSLVLLAITWGLIILVNHKDLAIPERTGRILLSAFVLFTVVIGANLFITRVGTDTGGAHLETYVPSGKADSWLKATALKHLDEVPGYDPDEFVRSDNLRNISLTRNSSMVLDYNSVSTFTSTLVGGIVDYNREMGNNAWNIVTVYDYNFRTYMDELASLKYLGKESVSKATLPYGYKKVYETDSANGTYEIYENSLALPAGYCYDKVVSESQAEDLDALEKQELSMITAIVDDRDAGRTGLADTGDGAGEESENADSGEDSAADRLRKDLTTKEVTIDSIKPSSGLLYEDGLITIEDPEDAKLTFSFESLPNAETYLVLEGDVVPVDDSREIEINTQCKADGVNYSGRFRLDNYSTGQKEYVYNLGYHKDVIRKCSLAFEDEGQLRMERIRICCLPMDTYESRVRALKEESMTHVRQDVNSLTGDIEVSRDKLLVISLPWQTGWTAYVDDQKVSPLQVNYQYMGLPLKKGSHKIRLVYEIPGLKVGIAVSLAGTGLFILIILFNLIRKRRRRRQRD